MNWEDIENAALAAGLALERTPIPGPAYSNSEPVTRVTLVRHVGPDVTVVEGIQNSYWSDSPRIALTMLEIAGLRKARQ
jgi:hypothetical protein